MSLVTSALLNHIKEQMSLDIDGYTNIGHGAHNQNYLLDTSRGKLMLRIYANTQFENTEKEYRVPSKIDGFLGPKPYYLDASKRLLEYDYMVLEYIEGTVIREFTNERARHQTHRLGTRSRKLFFHGAWWLYRGKQDQFSTGEAVP